ncbi:hypothetical protein FRB93_008325 [Tulasnella sp. JGI-2019a]|nr:hypothetical protein FRB93_008325 [Tulasnella sp. JGI-2019a]
MSLKHTSKLTPRLPSIASPRNFFSKSSPSHLPTTSMTLLSGAISLGLAMSRRIGAESSSRRRCRDTSAPATPNERTEPLYSNQNNVPSGYITTTVIMGLEMRRSSGPRCTSDDEDDIYRTFIRSAIREAYRWQSGVFYLQFNDSLRPFRDVYSLPVPRLEELRITCSDDLVHELKGGSIDLFGGRADRLRHVDISYFPMLWSSRILSRLETLNIISSSTVPGPSTTELIDILRRCPNLRQFAMSSEIRVSGAIPSKVEIARLPALKSFQLSVLDAETFNEIISSVRIPKCTQFDLMCHAAEDIFSDKADHFTSALLLAIQFVLEIRLELSVSELTLSGRHTENDPGPGIKVTLHSNSAWEILASLIDAAAPVPWPPINARITTYHSSPSLQVVNLLHKMPSVTRLVLLGDSDEFITRLSYPILNEGNYEWVLPNLKELHLSQCPKNNLALLIDLAKQRKTGVVRDRGDGVRLGLSTKLEMIRVPLPRSVHRMAKTGSFYPALQALKEEDGARNLID